MKYSCVIIDDEPIAHKVLKNYVAQVDSLEIKNYFFNAVDAARWLERNKIDLIFLDIQMPEITGMQFLRSLDNKPVTILTTAYRDYAIEGFELGVMDYLLKPFQINRFETAVNRALDFISLSSGNDTITGKNDYNNFELLIKTGTTKVLLDYRNITYAQGLKDYTILHSTGKKYVVKGSVKTLADYLPASHFLRVHKSFIVAKSKIKLVYRNKIEFDNHFIPVGRNYKAALDEFLTANQ